MHITDVLGLNLFLRRQNFIHFSNKVGSLGKRKKLKSDALERLVLLQFKTAHFIYLSFSFALPRNLFTFNSTITFICYQKLSSVTSFIAVKIIAMSHFWIIQQSTIDHFRYQQKEIWRFLMQIHT